MAFSLNDYEILDVIGTGGFGTVYRARQKSLGRIVAIKCLSPHRTQNHNDLIRFRREAEAMAALAHDNIISIFDYAYASGSYYIVMEYVEGISFEEARRRAIPTDLSLYVLEKAASALRCAHEKGIVHRDIKPANIFLGANGQVRLADFGLAFFEQSMTTQSAQAAIGTLAYMAPETMVTPGEVDGRADLFSLGCLLYEALAGSSPFPGETMAEISYKVLNQDAPAMNTDPVYAQAAALALRCLSKDREHRPAVDEIQSTLHSILRDCQAATPERLASFVRNETAGGVPAGSVTADKQPVRQSSVPESRRRLKYAVITSGASVVVLLAALVLLLFVRSGRDHSRPVPGFRVIEEAAKSGTPAGPAANPGTRAVPHDAPAPVTGDLAETRTGSLTVTGLLPGDTLVMNGEAVPIPEGATERMLPMETGHYRLEVRRTRGRVCVKEVEIMPYQIVEWNVNDKRTADRSSRR